MGMFNNNAKGSIVGLQAENVSNTSVTINGRRVRVGKLVKVELHYVSGTVSRFTEDDPENIADLIKDVKKNKRYSHVVIDGKRYGK